jgi:hypothetical protein
LNRATQEQVLDALLQRGVLLEIEGGLGEVGGLAEVAPVRIVCAEGLDFLALGGEADVGVDDGEGAGFSY